MIFGFTIVALGITCTMNYRYMKHVGRVTVLLVAVGFFCLIGSFIYLQATQNVQALPDLICANDFCVQNKKYIGVSSVRDLSLTFMLPLLMYV